MTEKYRPSNGTEGQYFMEEFCYRCKKDDPDNYQYCEILSKTMLYHDDDENYPAEWTYDENAHPVCTAFDAIK